MCIRDRYQRRVREFRSSCHGQELYRLISVASQSCPAPVPARPPCGVLHDPSHSVWCPPPGFRRGDEAECVLLTPRGGTVSSLTAHCRGTYCATNEQDSAHREKACCSCDFACDTIGASLEKWRVLSYNPLWSDGELRSNRIGRRCTDVLWCRASQLALTLALAGNIGLWCSAGSGLAAVWCTEKACMSGRLSIWPLAWLVLDLFTVSVDADAGVGRHRHSVAYSHQMICSHRWVASLAFYLFLLLSIDFLFKHFKEAARLSILARC
eukprot:TRINITY_DN14098_c0_g1_i3.p1 TRINITY_DN14098_c0_g1~~TRINITY_DN14098_c0_g1_i3.p1  ORF type:complete len:267 (+),score=7.43 TRINITY_DN14098_c0_g1_i3:138-938(+)